MKGSGYREYQQACAHGPRRFNAVAVYKRAQGTNDGALRAAVGRLLCAVEGIELETLNVLVGIGWSGLGGHPSHAELKKQHPSIPTMLAPLANAPTLRVDTQGDVLVQVAAETETDRLFALRLAEVLLAPEAELREEWFGVRRGLGREAFGYRDVHTRSEEYSRGGPLELALIKSGAAAGGGWLLYQRFNQNVGAFCALPDADRDDVMGIDPNGGAPRGPATRLGHVVLARKYRGKQKGWFVRRGFPYRERGEEGLCFLALAAAPESFTEAHDAMAGTGGGGTDALLAYVEAREGGVYFVPPSAEWIAPGVRPIALPHAVKDLERQAPLILAELTPAALEYAMSARKFGAFTGALGQEVIKPELRPSVEAANWLISQMSSTSPSAAYAELAKLLAKSLAQANAANLEAGEYVTLEP